MTDSIRIRVARELGYIQHAGNARWVSPIDGELVTLTQLPSYDTDETTAIRELCGLLKSEGFPIVLTNSGGNWVCVIYASKEIYADELANTSADSLALAVCLAFLKVRDCQTLVNLPTKSKP